VTVRVKDRYLELLDKVPSAIPVLVDVCRLQVFVHRGIFGVRPREVTRVETERGNGGG